MNAENIYKALSNPSFLLEVSKGNVPGHEAYEKWGRNEDIDSQMEWIWTEGGTHIWQTVAEPINIVSDSADDAGDGTGWDTCTVFGLDEDYNRISEAVTLSGTTPVATTLRFLHVYRINASNGSSVVGSGGVNAGEIIATFDGTTDVAAVVMPRQGVNVHLFDIVPAGVNLMVNEFKFTVFQVNPGLEAFITITPWVHLVGHGKQIIAPDIIDTDKENKIEAKLAPPFRIPEKTRWWVEIETNRDNTKVSGRISGMYVNNQDMNI